MELNPHVFEFWQSNRFAVDRPNRAALIGRSPGLFIVMLTFEIRKSSGLIWENPRMTSDLAC